MKAKHTPGPWITEDEHKPNYESYQIHNGKEIVAYGVPAKNAKLIAAAPKLLQQLKIAVTHIKNIETKYNPDIPFAIQEYLSVIKEATE